jgi:hypothetical protein
MATVGTRRPLPSKVSQHPPPLTLLDNLAVKFGKLVPPQGAADQKKPSTFTVG